MACGCGSTEGGCGSHAAPAPAPDIADTLVKAQEEAVAEAVAEAPRLIAGSEHAREWPELRVNGMPIAPAAIAQEIQYHPAASREEALYGACRALVIRELLQQRVLALGLAVAPAAGESEEEAAIAALIAREVTLPQVEEADLRRYFEANRERFVTAPLVAARHILLGAAPDDAEERSRQREVALGLIARLQQGEDFARLAAEASGCPSREQGGALGQVSRGQTVPEFERQLFRLPVGLAAQPLESRYGFHVVDLQHRVDGVALPYEAVAGHIREDLQQRAWQKAVAQYLQTLVGEADIEGIALDGADSPLLQ
jgi:peptidyl-prolyl cis-trans isomerase C